MVLQLHSQENVFNSDVFQVFFVVNDLQGREVGFFLETVEEGAVLFQRLDRQRTHLIGHQGSVGLKEDHRLLLVLVHLAELILVDVVALLQPVLGEGLLDFLETVVLHLGELGDVHGGVLLFWQLEVILGLVLLPEGNEVKGGLGIDDQVLAHLFLAVLDEDPPGVCGLETLVDA